MLALLVVVGHEHVTCFEFLFILYKPFPEGDFGIVSTAVL